MVVHTVQLMRVRYIHASIITVLSRVKRYSFSEMHTDRWVLCISRQKYMNTLETCTWDPIERSLCRLGEKIGQDRDKNLRQALRVRGRSSGVYLHKSASR